MQSQQHLFLDAANGKPTNRTPVWLMRQAGRVLPEYRKVREAFPDFKALVKNPEAACEVTLQPIDRWGVDAAIIFSDILVVPEAMGLNYEMEENKGPVFPVKIASPRDLNRVREAQPSALAYVTDAIRLVKRELNNRVPLIGFAGAPWTIFAYMVEGGGSKTFARAKKMLYAEPAFAHQLLDLITRSTIGYLRAQVTAGADLIQLFDSWAGLLGPEQYRTFSLPYIEKILTEVNDVPKTVFAKGAFFARAEMNRLNCQVVGLDWQSDIAESKTMLRDKVLQGNLDPCALYASAPEVVAETKKMIDAFGQHPHIANLGHGLYPDTEVDQVTRFVETVKEYSASKRALIGANP